ncbi:MAG: ASCH domain-containing protein [Pseudomonadales bacterium]
MSRLRAVTLTQPWATALVRGVKTIETRSWSTRYEGWFAVHAAKGWTLADREFALEDAWRYLQMYPEDYPRACIVGVAHLVKCVPADKVEPGEADELFGFFGPERFAWIVDQARELRAPIPCRGAQGWWPVPADVEAEMRKQFGMVPA